MEREHRSGLDTRSCFQLSIKRAIGGSLLVGTLAVGLVACDDLPTIPPSGEPLIDGWITEMGVTVSSTPRSTILVEADPGDGGHEKVRFYLETSTPVRYAVGKAPRRMVGIDGLEVGQRVEVWNEGVIFESLPAQAETAFIVIVCDSRTSCGAPGG